MDGALAPPGTLWACVTAASAARGPRRAAGPSWARSHLRAQVLSGASAPGGARRGCRRPPTR
eukprot:4328687-Lingulodinium_polyedra.AAC.1